MKRLFFLFLLVPAAAGARVISYAAYTSQKDMPAVQHRLNRHFVLVEFPSGYAPAGQAVLYDTKSEDEPRVISPLFGTTPIYAAAVREDDSQLAVFLQTSPNTAMLSVDRGFTWKPFLLPQFPAPS